MKMTMEMNLMPLRRLSLQQLLAVALSLAILTAALFDPRAIPLREIEARVSVAGAPATVSNLLPDLGELRGGDVPPVQCAMFLAGAAVGLLAGAVAIGLSAGAATPVVIGLALGGSLLPAASLAC